MTECACAGVAGVKPEPPAAVAARGLTPATLAKPGLGPAVSGGVVAAGVRIPEQVGQAFRHDVGR
jgi:hypothetical protein